MVLLVLQQEQALLTFVIVHQDIQELIVKFLMHALTILA
jgi:hypothetical protein